MKAALAISIYKFNHDSFLCANVFGICAPPSTTWVLGNYASITAVTIVYCLRMSSWRFKIGWMSWGLFLKFIFVLAISDCSFMPSMKAHMVFLVLLRFFEVHFVKKTYIFKCNVSFTALVPLAARLEPCIVTKVSHCILIFHSVSTLHYLYTEIYIYILYIYIYTYIFLVKTNIYI